MSSEPHQNSVEPLSGDIIVLPAGGGRWVVANVFSRSAIGTDSCGLALLNGETAPDDGAYPVWEISRFSNVDGLLADPTWFLRDPDAWPDREDLDRDGFLEKMHRHSILVGDREAYLARFSPKQSILDRTNFGNFHERLGQELLTTKRLTAESWWVTQKFTPDLTALQETLYKAGEGTYLASYFQERFDAGEVVLDLGCGPGFYARQIGGTGAEVIGIDPSSSYIDKANQIRTPNVRFSVGDIGKAGGLDQIESASVDTVFVSDALLFYFVPPALDTGHDLNTLFGDIRRVLKPGGRLISVEPHHVFWLQPWLGDPDRPFTLQTEYRRNTYRVTPTPADFIAMFTEQGFAVVWMDEIYATPGAAEIDERAENFAGEFPIGQIYELRLRPEAWA
jgi:SAM-dependent methyltransferase